MNTNMRILFGLVLFGGALGWGEKERVRLEDVQVLTLTRGAMTTARFDRLWQR